MPEQLSLPGIDPALHARDRLFFAIFPDPAAAARIGQLALDLRREHGLKGRPLAPARLHATLYHLGDYAGLPQDVIEAASAAAASIAMPPCDVEFDCASSFTGSRGKRPLVLLGDEGLAALTAFQRALVAVLKKAGLGGRASHYTPHITLLYGNRQIAAQAVPPVSWTAHEFVLVHSLLGQTTHVPLAKWPLADSRPLRRGVSDRPSTSRNVFPIRPL